MNHGYDASAGLRLVGYTRVSTAEQGQDGLGMAVQEQAIRRACEERGWLLHDLVKEVRSGGDADRPRLTSALGLLDRQRAKNGRKPLLSLDGLIVAKLDRLTRSVREFAEILERARRNGWRVIVLDLGVDTTTPAGEMMAGMVSVFAQFERRLIQSRTKDALAQAKARGVKLGAPIRVSEGASGVIVSMRASGHSMRAIAESLSAGGYAAPDGGSWSHSTVQRVLARIAAVATESSGGGIWPNG